MATFILIYKNHRASVKDRVQLCSPDDLKQASQILASDLCSASNLLQSGEKLQKDLAVSLAMQAEKSL